jgi:hypothetical protein
MAGGRSSYAIAVLKVFETISSEIFVPLYKKDPDLVLPTSIFGIASNRFRD